MKQTKNPPFAPNLIESMRSIGYSFETAMADIVDNSIAANATNVDILAILNKDNSYVSILDDGIGMSRDKLINAMRYGSFNPDDKRFPNDMGRFGLGLKSASLSQCRKLTVLSKSEKSDISGYVWDIDYVKQTGDWNLQELENSELETVQRYEELFNQKSGTLIIWENFDRLEISTIDVNDSLKELIESVSNHFSLIYHRLLNNNFKIVINGFEVEPRDPFLEKNKATQMKREQKFYIDNQPIIVKPFILPHLNKLSLDDIAKIGGKESLRTEQGFYIYRNKRLIIWGTWFRLKPQGELSKLARVRVDIPNALDYIWDIDIKKSKVSLPKKIKYDLYNAILQSCNISEQIYIYKGRKVMNNEFIKTWNIIEKRKGEGMGLEINLNNPLIEEFVDSLSHEQKHLFSSILSDIEDTLPLDYIYTKIAKGEENRNEKNIQEKEIEFENIKKRIDNYIKLGNDKKDLINIFLSYEKYANDKFFVKKLNELRDSKQ